MSARFVHPEWSAEVALLWLGVGLAVALARWLLRRRRAALGAHVGPGVSLGRDAALWLALAAIGLALLGPRLGQTVQRLPGDGVDVMLLVDVSRSMDATDTRPTRFVAARDAAHQLLARLAPQDRAGLAVFASRGVLLAPLTPDTDALAELLDALDTNLVAPAGSALDRGVDAAIAGFEDGSERPRVLFVLSDGEDPGRRSTLGSGAALRAEVRVLAAGFGSEAGARLSDGGAPLRARDGTPVVSRRDLRHLERLAEATGGRVFAADAQGTLDFDAAAAALRAHAGGPPGEPVLRRVPAVRVAPLAALAFLLLAVEAVGLRRRWAAAAAGVALASLLLGAGSRDELARLEAALSEAPGDARRLLELGVARLEHGRRAEAERALRAAALGASDPSLAALAYYDLGVAALADGALETARDAFFDALALAPEDREARFNLEWTLEALHHEPPPAPEPPAAEPPAPPEPRATQAEAPEPGASAAPEPLEEAQRLRWLERVEDDLGHALRAAASADAPRGRRRARPAW